MVWGLQGGCKREGAVRKHASLMVLSSCYCANAMPRAAAPMQASRVFCKSADEKDRLGSKRGSDLMGNDRVGLVSSVRP